jgi:hypothetical protein
MCNVELSIEPLVSLKNRFLILGWKRAPIILVSVWPARSKCQSLPKCSNSAFQVFEGWRVSNICNIGIALAHPQGQNFDLLSR